MLRGHLDFETFSPEPLSDVGVHKYSVHPCAGVWVFGWRIGNEMPVQQWHPYEPPPREFLNHVAQGGTVVAHNAGFELATWNVNLIPHYGLWDWPRLDVEQLDCTMARCAQLTVPESLDEASRILKTGAVKDMEGNALAKKMGKPRKRWKCTTCQGEGCVFCSYCGEQFTWWDSADYRKKLDAYNVLDVLAECALDETAPLHSPRERLVWLRNMKTNIRGITIDVELVHKAKEVVTYAKDLLDKEARVLTAEAIQTLGQSKGIAEWITAQGLHCTSVAKTETEFLLDKADKLELPQVRRIIELRSKYSKTSTAKLWAITDCLMPDNTIKDQTRYHGASTGREAGRLVQPTNFPRPERVKGDSEKVAQVIDVLMKSRNARDAHTWLNLMFDDPMTWISQALRSLIIPAPGNKLVGGDLSNIEGRVNATTAGEMWKLIAFKEYDAGIGPDLYKLAYSKSFGKPVDLVDDGDERQVGKVEELGLGYQGSVMAIMKMLATYGLTIERLAPLIKAAIDPASWAVAELEWEQASKRGDTDMRAFHWIACKVLVNAFRSENKAIVQSWWDRQDAAIEAVANPGHVTEVCRGLIKYVAAGGFLWTQLPSGRHLAYFNPSIKYHVETLTDKNGHEYTRTRKQVWYEGYKRLPNDRVVWTEDSLYGGHQCENDTQGIARDVLEDLKELAAAAGFPLDLSVYDEMLNEAPLTGELGRKQLKAIMETPPLWLPDLPLAAKTWEGMRYAK